MMDVAYILCCLYVTQVLIWSVRCIVPLSLQVCVVSFGVSFIYHHTARKWAGQWGGSWHWKGERRGVFGEVCECLAR